MSSLRAHVSPKLHQAHASPTPHERTPFADCTTALLPKAGPASARMARPRVAHRMVVLPSQSPHEPRCLSDTRVRPRSEFAAPRPPSTRDVRPRSEAHGDRAQKQDLPSEGGQDDVEFAQGAREGRPRAEAGPAFARRAGLRGEREGSTRERPRAEAGPAFARRAREGALRSRPTGVDCPRGRDYIFSRT